ncbi:Bug family tripartite tricarboxylate transporter substrate binding protein [Sabulicella glaciei]|uniref:Tripartite tricarboxylate transporter substrate binding protein n=1 Tax=Sabulicella glaciei TaxID=2984948 RepID=A0ABT3NYC4_9PROT|nr:tripartite tricarboxylate transporter substrate binding protein [Roseococcus sp. MDT2-1-1]MCW8087171.1 tripartite tricarboxylate transporter substrate binding protein [Roseococcus sp. MDT2-1-1]
MPLPSRRHLLAGIAGMPAAAAAQALPAGWPDRPIRLVVPAAGGAGTADTIARLLAIELDKRLPQRTLVENRPGANGNVGATAVARAAPDGHTFLFSWSGTLATSPALYRELSFDPKRDFEPVILLGNVPNILVVTNGIGVRTLEELTARLRREPGALSFGSSGNGSSMHLAGELYRQRTGTEMSHVPYATIQQGFTDLFTGRIQLMFNLVTGAAPQVRGGQVTPVAILSDRRSSVLPDVPTTAELGMPGLEFGSWFCIMAPRGTPAPIVATMNRLVNEILTAPESRARMEAQGLDIIGGEPEQLATLLDAELARHAELVRFSGVRVE